MGLRTWKVTIKGEGLEKSVGLKMLKGQAEKVESIFHQLTGIRKYTEELTGVIGNPKDEHGCTLWSPFGEPEPLRDEEGFKADFKAWFDSIPAEADLETIKPICEAARVLFKKHLRVVDNRRTPEQDAAQRAESKALEQKRAMEEAEKTARFVAEFGEPERPEVEIMAGMMAVVAQMTYDNSDSMTDYHSPHVSHGQEFLLTVANGATAQTERLARFAVAAYPALADVAFEWHTENYSMGHGNYLMGKQAVPGYRIEQTYGGHGPAGCVWEIQFTKTYDSPRKFYVFKGYPGTGATPTAEASPAPVAVDKPTVSENTAKGGIEIRFPAKPAPEILEKLNGAGWRFSRFNRCWYKRVGPGVKEFAESLAGAAS